MPWLARDRSENSTNGLFSSLRAALLVSAVSGRRRVAFPPTGIITRSLSGA
jgi:hypothetical protein